MMTKEQALNKLCRLEQVLKALPEGADILSVAFHCDSKYDQILLSGFGTVPKDENAETTVESSGAKARTIKICGFRVKWYEEVSK